MKIKTRIRLILAILLILILLTVSLEMITSYKLDKSQAQDTVVHHIQVNISLLKSITYDYMNNYEVRAKDQWIIEYNDIIKRLSTISYENEADNRIFGKISTDMKSMSSVLNYLEQNHKKLIQGNEMIRDSFVRTDERLKNELFILLEEVSGDLNLVADINMVSMYNTRELGKNMRLGAMLIFGLMSLYLIWVLGRNILVSIETLEKALGVMDKGDLSYQIPISGNDEISSFAMRFNTMTKNLKLANEEINNAKNAAEEANMAKSQFLANMSHEIRTPLNGIVGMSQLLQLSDMDDSYKKMSDAIAQCSKNLVTIINDILDLSKIEAGKLELSENEFYLESLIENMKKTFSISAHKKNLELLFRVEPNAPEIIIGDEGKISQILINIIGNAIKFTDNGHIYLSIKKLIQKDNDVQLEFIVADTGIGIGDDAKNRIFHPFVQGDISYRKKYQGTGLGLTISKRLVEIMGGDISFESTVGQGTTFTFSLNLNSKEILEIEKRENKAGVHEKKHIDYEKINVLVIDDNVINREIVKEMIEDFGMGITLCESGKVGLDLISKQRFDLILLDIHMPEMDGFDVLEKINELHITHPICIIFLTSIDIGNKEIKEKIEDVDAFLVKPIMRKDLISVINDCLKKKLFPKDLDIITKIEGTTLLDATISHEDCGILIVEDNKSNQDVVTMFLDTYKYKYDVVCNGKDAVIISKKKKYSIILMDIQLPVISGLEALKNIREDSENPNRKSVIIATTAYALEGDKERFVREGFDDYIPKPFVLNEFMDIISHYTNTK